MSREWPFPDLRNGTTIALVTDRHHGTRSYTAEQLARVGGDLIGMHTAAQGIIDAGDSIDWGGADNEAYDVEAKAWTDDVKAGTGLPYVWVPGNHDLASWSLSQERTKEQWAAAVGQPSALTVTDVNGVRILGVSADTWYLDDGSGYGPCVLSEATLTWLDEQLTAAGSMPVFIANHAPLWEQYARDPDPEDTRANSWWWTSPQADLTSLIDGHSNVKGWVSGHIHADIQYRADTHVQSMLVGSRKIFAINGPASGGLVERLSPSSLQQTQSPVLTTWFTWMGDALDVRWYDHKTHRWTESGGVRRRHVLLEA